MTDSVGARRKDLQELLQKAFDLLGEYERQLLLTSDPRERQRCQEEIDDLKATIATYQCELSGLGKEVSAEAGAKEALPATIIGPHGKEMVLVPAGEFIMGTAEEEAIRLARQYSAAEEPRLFEALPPTLHLLWKLFEYGAAEETWLSEETPQRSVYLRDFYIDKTPVTNADYQRFIDANPGHQVPYFQADWARPYNWDPSRRTYPEGQGDHPVVLVSWMDATAYALWAGVRLPAEAEWEKAARGDDGRSWPWGNTWDAERCNCVERWAGRPLPTLRAWEEWWEEWLKQSQASHVRITTMPVSSHPTGASAWGVLDMAGNVWEWTADWYRAYPGTRYGSEEYGEKYRVLRGGSWYGEALLLRAACRHREDPAKAYSDIGFRCALSPPRSGEPEGS
jgi:sulfatase modifying factor 1